MSDKIMPTPECFKPKEVPDSKIVKGGANENIVDATNGASKQLQQKIGVYSHKRTNGTETRPGTQTGAIKYNTQNTGPIGPGTGEMTAGSSDKIQYSKPIQHSINGGRINSGKVHNNIQSGNYGGVQIGNK